MQCKAGHADLITKEDSRTAQTLNEAHNCFLQAHIIIESEILEQFL